MPSPFSGTILSAAQDLTLASRSFAIVYLHSNCVMNLLQGAQVHLCSRAETCLFKIEWLPRPSDYCLDPHKSRASNGKLT